jgi:NAD(P)-dependent dehydrogenase (short-subunit alcohol dehydrogenase family)
MSLSDFHVKGQVAIITGGAHGIGLAAAGLLAEAGASIALFDRDAEAADAAARALSTRGYTAVAHGVDVTDEAAVAKATEAVADRFGRLDILINNAGIAIRRPATELTLEDWNTVIGVNLTGMFLVARHAARFMQRAGRGGAIVNTASIMGLSGGLYPNIAYQTSKGGVVNMTRALALEWAPDNIRVNAIAPTYVRTRLIAGLMADADTMATISAATPLGRIAEPEEVANAILFLASPAAQMITGTILPVDGGFLAR